MDITSFLIFKKIYFLIEGKLLYRILLVSVKPQHEISHNGYCILLNFLT